jgi:pyrophosphatase PpaX
MSPDRHPRPPRCLLLDLDGTLLDTCPLLFAAFRHTVTEHLGRDPDYDEWFTHFGLPIHHHLQALGVTAVETTEMVATYRAFVHAHHDDYVRCYDGVAEAISTMHRAGVRLAAVTSKSRRLALRNLEFVGLFPLFTAVVAEEDATRHKPYPEPVLVALERVGAAPEDAVMVGDSPYDVAAARAAGVCSAAALWGPFSRAALAAEPPDFWLERPADLLALFALL